MKHRIPLSIGAIILAACSAPAAADDATPILHPVAEACVTYDMSGQMMNGSLIRCHRDNGYEIYEIEQTEIGFGGMSRSQNAHRITIGPTIYNIDTATNTGTQTTNPMYQQIADAVANDGSDDVSAAFLSAMGYTATGQSKTIAGENCDVYASQFVGTACLTRDGLMLEQEMMGNLTRATSVSYTPGEDANYRLYETATISDGPDLSNGIGGIDLGDLIGTQ